MLNIRNGLYSSKRGLFSYTWKYNDFFLSKNSEFYAEWEYMSISSIKLWLKNTNAFSDCKTEFHIDIFLSFKKNIRTHFFLKELQERIQFDSRCTVWIVWSLLLNLTSVHVIVKLSTFLINSRYNLFQRMSIWTHVARYIWIKFLRSKRNSLIIKDEVTYNKYECSKSIQYILFYENMNFLKSFQYRLPKDSSGFELRSPLL